MGLALNRHHKKRIKNKVKNYHNCSHYTANRAKRIGIVANTRCLCSCNLCIYDSVSHRDAKLLNDPDY